MKSIVLSSILTLAVLSSPVFAGKGNNGNGNGGCGVGQTTNGCGIVDWFKGDKGDKGDKGEQGLQGIQGEQGLKGDKGDRGEQGLKGDTGSAGINGKDGIDGTNGINGKDGIDGKDGINGTNGIDGKDGAQGEKGDSGADGKKGETGLTGAAGLNGVDGLNGKNGKDADMSAVNANAKSIKALEQSTNKRFASLQKQVDRNRDHASAGISGVAAMANIPQVSQGSAFSVGAGVGAYDGESALAVGVSARFNENVVTKASVAMTSESDAVLGAGVSYEW